MDISSIIGGGTPEKEHKPAIEYEAQADSPLVNGDAKITIGENSLTVTALFDVAEILFAEINAIELADYVVTVKSDSGDYSFSSMGNWCRPFYDALCGAFNKAVLRVLFIDGNPIFTAEGDYRFVENGLNTSGSAPIHIYENCVAALPHDSGARRIPLCFVNGMDKGNYELTLRLDAGESYTFSKLGYETVPFADAIEKQIRKLREKALSSVKDIDPFLTAAQASQIAKLMPEGAAAPIGRLGTIASTFVSAMKAKINETRAADSYRIFQQLCDPAQIYIGFIKNEAMTESSQADGMSGALSGIPGGSGDSLSVLSGIIRGASPAGSEDTEILPPDPYLLWLIAPSPDGQYAAVEFAEADSATFVYRTGGDFPAFAAQLNRALEAISFRREVIRLSDEELLKPENADYYMADKRTASLRFIRAKFAGRVIHSSPESWKKKLLAIWNGDIPTQPQTVQTSNPIENLRFCVQCGAALTPSAKFCGDCGAKV